jgi:hypothetical protein
VTVLFGIVTPVVPTCSLCHSAPRVHGLTQRNPCADYGDAYPQHKDKPGDTKPEYNLTCCTKSKIMAAKTALDKDKVPIAYMQLDDWWAKLHGMPSCRGPPGGMGGCDSPTAAVAVACVTHDVSSQVVLWTEASAELHRRCEMCGAVGAA